MNCQEATLLISARIDGDLAGDRIATLDAHLAECEACRVTLTEMETQDAVLMRAFLPRQGAANAVADRVWQEICRDEVWHRRPASAPQPGRPCHGEETQRCAQVGHRMCGFSSDNPIPPLAASQISEAVERGFSTDGGDRSATPQAAEPVCLKKTTSAQGVQRLSQFRKRFTFIAGWAAAAAVGFLAAMVVARLTNPRQPQYVVQALIPGHCPGSSPLQTNVPVQPVAHLTLATGDVFVCPSTEKTWRPISRSDPIDLLAGVRTADAKCELRLPDGSCVRLNSQTEARFTSGRTLSVSAGEVWSAVPRDAAPLCVSAGQTCVTARGAGCAQGTQFDLSRAAGAATVAVARGAADVMGNGPPTTVRGGQILLVPSPSAVGVCSTAPDPLLAARWQDELLVLKPADDPEVTARVDQLLARIVTDRGMNESPGAAEQDVRAGGPVWCTPLACFLRTQPGGAETRRTAARLLGDLAPPSRIPDLIGLLTDADSEVCHQAAIGLRRLTGQTLGSPVERPDPAAAMAWREWWEQNKFRYQGRK